MIVIPQGCLSWYDGRQRVNFYQCNVRIGLGLAIISQVTMLGETRVFCGVIVILVYYMLPLPSFFTFLVFITCIWIPLRHVGMPWSFVKKGVAYNVEKDILYILCAFIIQFSLFPYTIGSQWNLMGPLHVYFNGGVSSMTPLRPSVLSVSKLFHVLISCSW